MSTLLYGYLAGWIVTSIAAALASRKLHRPTRPGSHLIAAAAGAAWPVLLLGAAQTAVVALVAEVVRRRASRHVSIVDLTMVETRTTPRAVGDVDRRQYGVPRRALPSRADTAEGHGRAVGHPAFAECELHRRVRNDDPTVVT